ncbi:hypothetical protein DFJ63DRAFT_54033 [Scheffersomyces coipomensis]|uniref:uncharacterized protein n=1 Tax=Scheffersomyces coipomensis TaxID=1788519 RepID=UPI00315C746C
MSSIDLVSSEDLGFKLDSDGQGLKLFDQPIDLDSYNEDNLNLLAVGNINKYFAASNVTSLKLGYISSLDSLKTVTDTFKITQLYFNSDESKLYVVNHSKLYYILINDYFNTDKFDLKSYHGDDIIDDIKSISPSSKSPDSVLIHTNSGGLYLNNKSDKIGEDIVSYTWSDDGSIFYINNNDPLNIHCKYYTKQVIPLDLELENYQPIDIRTVKSSILISYKNEEEDITQTYLIDANGTPSLIDVAPPFNSVERANEYYGLTLVKWISDSTFYFVTSSLATDISTIKLEISETTLVEPSEDSQRAQFPIDDDTGDDTSAVGFALDVTGIDTNVLEPWNGIEAVKGKLPRLLTLLNSGHLISWWVYDKSAITDDKADLSNALKYYQREQSATVAAVAPATATATPAISNPFGSTAPASFGAANPFGSSTASSLFAKESSPFGGFTAPVKEIKPISTEDDNKSAFGGFKTNNSSLSSNIKPETSSGSNFGSSGFGGSGFGNSGKPAFGGSGFGSSGFGGFAAKQPSAFGSTENTNTTASTFGSYSAGPSNNSPFAKFAQNESSSSSSPFASLNSQADSKKEVAKPSIFGSKSATTETKPLQSSPFASLDKKVAEPSPFSKLNNKEAEPSPFSKFNGKEAESSPFAAFKAPAIEKTPAVESPIPISGLNINEKPLASILPSFESGLKLTEDPVKPAQQFSSSEVEDTEENVSDEDEEDESDELESFEEIASEDFESEDVVPDNVVTEPVVAVPQGSTILQKDEIAKSTVKPITKIELLKFSGISKKDRYSKDVITNKILEIFNETSGNVNILERNVKSLIEMIDSQSNEIQDPKLDSPDQWTLQSVGILQSEISEEIDSSKSHLKTLKDQEQELKSITDRLHKTHQLRIQLDKHFSQLSSFKNDAKSSILKKRPLSLKDEVLQIRLREKVTKFRELENQIVSKLMPLKAKIRLDDTVMKNLETTIFQIHSTLINHEETIANLVNSLAEVEENEPNEDPDSITDNKSSDKAYSSRWAASEVLKNRKVQVRKITI